ncbi:MAG: 7-cyano-7-deazaguanine synthase [Candidatus Caldarchaeum sp.]|nr:7-cyano-7-deazaguanine synthase [Candidatus Caldarchaeum sp.]
MKTVALLSGGIDSTVMLWKLKHEGHEIIPLTFLTYRRNTREVEAVKGIASSATNKELRIIDVSFLREVVDFPQSLKDKLSSETPTVLIPFRNIIFYSAAAHIALYENAENVAGGHTVEDLRIPDVGNQFVEELEKLLKMSAPFSRVKVLTPLIGMNKKEVIKLGSSLNAPLTATWSCWGVLDKHCGRCPGCVARRAGFAAAGLVDETEYAET